MMSRAVVEAARRSIMVQRISSRGLKSGIACFGTSGIMHGVMYHRVAIDCSERR